MSDFLIGEVLAVKNVMDQPFGGMVFLAKQYGADLHIASLDENGRIEFLQENTIYITYDRLQYAMKMRPLLGPIKTKGSPHTDIIVSPEESDRILGFFTKHGIVVT